METNVVKKNQNKNTVKKNQKETVLVGIVTDEQAIELPKPIKFETVEQARDFADKVVYLSKQHSSIKSNLDFLNKVSKESLEASKLASDGAEYGILVMDLKTINELKTIGRLSEKHTLIKKQEVVNQFSIFVGRVMSDYLAEVENELLNIQK